MKSFFNSLNGFWEQICDSIYFRHLKTSRKNDHLVTWKIVERVKELEEQSYPEQLRLWNRCESMEDFLGMCNSSCIEQVYYYIGENWYFICADNRKSVTLVDFASATGLCREVLNIIDYIAIISKGRSINIYSRETTSYRLFCALAKRDRITMESDKCYYSRGEFYHKILIKPNPKYYNRKRIKNAKKKIRVDLQVIDTK